ncbi:carbon-nitrogen hydrolase family protein [Gimesia aquarii]|uniref:Aliphatic nitrilase n=1 Tax=Gimesia aquarii TaxID=2527964 RepID=A0A517WYF5_9PLAN|nr:carbon-nitrogen hydrolase family protein [Gimesia aquarii]QDU10285.1 Aliphatic nitrilase [Gimesia aquarii]
MSNQPQTVKAAAVQAASVLYDREKTLDKAVALIEEAANAGAELVGFPESFLPGYPYHIWLGAPNWYQSLFKEWFLNNVEVNSKTTDILCESARTNSIDIVMGVSEREGNSCYNTLLFINRRGELLGKHRKIMPTHAERTHWGLGGGGKNIKTYDFENYRLSGLLCWEHSMDLMRHAVIAERPQIHVGAWVGGMAISPWWDQFEMLSDLCSRYHAHAGDCFVLNVHGALDQTGFNKLCETDYQADKLRMGGGLSSIIAPGGKLLAGPVIDEETILYADLDFSAIADWAYFHDAVGHYARPDLLSLMVNTEEYHVTRPMAATPVDHLQHKSIIHSRGDRSRFDFPGYKESTGIVELPNLQTMTH